MLMINLRTRFLPLICFAILLAGCTRAASTQPAAPQTSEALPPRPNILIILTDDQPAGTMDYMPLTQARIFDQGVEFTRGYVTTPQCCPSRASILTGLYATHHAVHLNSEELDHAAYPTVVMGLHEGGYYTGLVGKYLNTYPLTTDDPPRSEFDSWVAFISGGENVSYFNPLLDVQGTWSEHEGYLTYLLRDYAVEFLDTAARRDQPFFLIFAPYAPHKPPIPARGDEALYPGLEPFRPPSFNEEDVSDKPAWIQEEPPLTDEQIAAQDADRRAMLQTLNAVDQSVDMLLTTLDAQGKFDETIVFFLSDNGHFWGEHRLGGKIAAYEEASRVPFAVRYPPLIPEPYDEDRLVANIDIAPTLYELAGVQPPPLMDGLSLVGLLRDESEWRDALVLEGWRPAYKAMHTDRYVYIETDGQIQEFYDLELDPYQLDNAIDDPAYTAIIEDLRARLTAFRGP